MRGAGWALAAALLAGAAVAQPSQKLHLTPPGEAAPPSAKGASPPAAAAPLPAWPPMPAPLAQEPPALGRLRGLLGPEARFGARAATQQGEVLTLEGAELRRDRNRMVIERLVLEGLTDAGLARAEMRGIAADTDAGPFRIAELDLAGVALLPLPPGQAAGDRRADQVAVERLRLAGLEVGGASPMAIALLAVDGWRPGSPGAARLERLDVRLPPGQPADRAQVARASLEGLDLAGMMGNLLRDEPPAMPNAGRQVKRLEGLSVTRDGRPVGGVGRLVIENEAGADGAMRARVQVHDAAIERIPELAEVFGAVGLSRLSLELAIEGAWAPQDRRLVLPAFAFGVRELGALAVGAVLDGVEIGAAAPNPDAITLVEGRLRYVDQSLYARMVADQARRERIPEARVRQQHAQMIGGALTDARADPALDALRNTLLRFVRGEVREVEVALRPARPVVLGALPAAASAGPAEMVRILGLSASAR